MCSADVASLLQSWETRLILLDVVLTPVPCLVVQVHVAVAVNVHVNAYVNVDGIEPSAGHI